MLQEVLLRRSGLNRSVLVLSGLFLALFLASLIWFVLADPAGRRRVFFFPVYNRSEVAGEERYLPLRDHEEADLDLYVRELLLGPVQVEHDPLFPDGTRLRSLLFRDGNLYIDLSAAAVTGNLASRLSFEETLETARRGLRFNFPFLEEIIISVEGSVPKKIPLEREN